jgi:carbon-monoxide dehydrogenase iron sulfur subunit
MPHVVISRKRCTGCHMCELACSAYHEGAYRPSLSRLRVEVNPTTGAISGSSCVQTACHKCQDVCPPGAISTEKGVLYVDEAVCDACTGREKGPACVEVCPWRVIHLHPATGKAFKCDLCRGGEPQCVAFCQNPYVLAVTLKADKADLGEA